ncbi:MAG: DUF4126 family protein, partial [Magnetococcales bacterium]|nr:DUF4126 family protein [Magnetococcales bacterium]
SAATHATKAGGRVLINTSPEPVSNWTASIAEDLAVIGGLWTALNHPTAFFGLLLLSIALMIWLLPKIWRGVVTVFRWLGGLFGLSSKREDTPQQSESVPPSASTRESTLDSLERLTRLRDNGTLTEEEFQAQKQRLLE